LRRLKQTHTAKPKLADCVCAALGPGFHRVQFHKDPENKFACPVLGKVFTDSTHIVANKKSGNVYCMQAIEELNIKAKNWKVPRGLIHVRIGPLSCANGLGYPESLADGLSLSPLLCPLCRVPVLTY